MDNTSPASTSPPLQQPASSLLLGQSSNEPRPSSPVEAVEGLARLLALPQPLLEGILHLASNEAKAKENLRLVCKQSRDVFAVEKETQLKLNYDRDSRNNPPFYINGFWNGPKKMLQNPYSCLQTIMLLGLLRDQSDKFLELAIDGQEMLAPKLKTLEIKSSIVGDSQLSTYLSKASGLTSLTLIRNTYSTDYFGQPKTLPSTIFGLGSLKKLSFGSTHTYNHNTTSLAGISQLTNLTSLKLLNENFDYELTEINTLSGLNILFLQSFEVQQLNIFSALSNLRKLVLISCGTKKLQDVQTFFPNLNHLQLEYNRGLDEYSGLMQLSALTSLILNCAWRDQKNQEKIINTLTNLTNLQNLGLENANLDTPAVLKSLSGLRSLSLAGCTLNSLQGIEHFSGLQRLVLYGCTTLTTLQDLEQLAGLTQLDIRETSWDLQVPEALRNRTNLEIISED